MQIILHFFAFFLHFFAHSQGETTSSPESSHTMRGVSPCGAPFLRNPHRRAECSMPLCRPLSISYTLAPTTRAAIAASLRLCSVGDVRRPAQPLATPLSSLLGVFIIPRARCYRRVMARLRWVCASLQRPPSGIAGRRRAPFGCQPPRVPTPEGVGASGLPRWRFRAVAPPLSLTTIADIKKLHHAAQNTMRHKKTTPCGTHRHRQTHLNETRSYNKKSRAPALRCATISKFSFRGCLGNALFYSSGICPSGIATNVQYSWSVKR